MKPPLTVAALTELLQQRHLAARVLEVVPLKPDEGDGPGAKVAGYGRPVKIVAEDAEGNRKTFVFHTASPNEFGHDRRADRVDELVLSYDTYRLIPRHVEPLDVGMISAGAARSMREGGEPYLLTRWAEGHPYAEDLRHIAARGVAPLDLARCGALAAYLVELHAKRLDAPGVYRRSIRDLLGQGEGTFGIVDSYPADLPGVPPARLEAIEHRCLEWRWRLRRREQRLARIHGDFHPFNILFSDGVALSLVDASRGCAGDPADDVAALAINYLFFCVDCPEAWSSFGQLWDLFWSNYLEGSKDDALLEVVAPHLAWRGLVVSNPKFYPTLSDAGRERVLGFVERILAAPSLDLSWAGDCLR